MSKLDAYYYSFEPTGNKDIDSILEAVAEAGHAFHHTEDWNDSISYVGGVSAVDQIQEAANKAASNLTPKGG